MVRMRKCADLLLKYYINRREPVMFSTKHIIILVVCISFVIAATILLKKFKPKLKTVVGILGVIGLISESTKMCTYIVINEPKLHGYLPKTDLPFHICSLQLILIVILLLTKNENLKRLLYSFMMPTCLIGGVLALLIPTSSSLGNPIIMVQYFMYHSSILVFALYLMLTDEIIFTVRDYFKTIIMLIGMLFVAIYLNSWINDYQSNINFMYVVRPPQDGLPILNLNHGWLVYICHYICTGIIFCKRVLC